MKIEEAQKRIKTTERQNSILCLRLSETRTHVRELEEGLREISKGNCIKSMKSIAMRLLGAK